MATVPYTLDQAEEDIATLRGQLDAMTEVLSLVNGASNLQPNPQPNTSQIFSLNGIPQWRTPAGVIGSVPGILESWFPGNTVTGTGLGNLAAYTIAANDAIPTAVYEVEAWGNGVQTPSNRQTLQFAVKLGGQTMAALTFGTTAFSTADSAWRWWAIARAICHSNGASGTWTSFLFAVVSDFSGNLAPGNANMAAGTSCENTGTTTQDTTTTYDLGVSAGWGSTSGSPSITSQVALAKRLC